MASVGSGNLQGPSAFEHEAEALQEWATSYTLTSAWDSNLRFRYKTAINAAVDRIRAQAASKQITWYDAATKVQQMRNDLMQVMRRQSSPIGRALAEWLKKEGRTLNELIARYSVKRFGSDVEFDALTQAQKDLVFADIVEAAARSRASFDVVAARVGRISRGLLVLSIAISVYEISISSDPVKTAKREGAFLAGGVVGGMAGGALAGLACGPGAPVCVTVGAFVGGALTVLGISAVWN